MTDDQKTKMSEAAYRRWSNPEERAKISVALTGYKASAQACANNSAAKMGNTYALGHHHFQSEETKAKISGTLMGNTNGLGRHPSMMGNRSALGHHMSEEAKAGISQKLKGIIPSDACRAAAFKFLYRGGKRVSKAKRRLLGFTPLNSWFVGCEGHHINKADVIYLPRKLHRSISHNQWTGRNMDKINALAGQYLTEDWT